MTPQQLIHTIQTYQPDANTALLTQAYEFSERVHRGQRRRSGEPYFVHPAEVAKILTDMKLDVPTIITGLLHDTVEDTLITLKEVEQQFGTEVAYLVDGVTKISRIHFTSHEERQAENFRKMIRAMDRDIRVVLVKLADRAHNMRTLSYLSADKQREIARETLDIYAPLAHRLGIYWLKSELEDNALRYLHPEVYEQLKRDIAQKKTERAAYIDKVISILKNKLDQAQISAQIHGRPKHFYSIYQKMESHNLLFDQIYDLVAFRIIVDSISECYGVLGIVHSHWKPVPGRFKDYIALPKANRYRSLHTTVIGPYGDRIEVQIRTHEMHRTAEEGIAAHLTYKESCRVMEEDQRFSWLHQLLEWQQQVQDPNEFLRTVKDDLLTNEVSVFTPKGDLHNFPQGASVVDFAYRVHSEVGNHCTGGRVNGRLVPLRYQLCDGDTVEILTKPDQTPSKDWLKIVKTPKAKTRIRQWVKAQERQWSITLGRGLLELGLARHQLDVTVLRKQGKLEAAIRALGYKGEEALLAALGYRRLTVRNLLPHLLSPNDTKQWQTQDEAELAKLLNRPVCEDGGRSGVQVGRIGDNLVRFGRCCNPLPGERIRGVLTRDKGVTVHEVECQCLLESDPQRHVEVSWDNADDFTRTVTVEVLSEDRPGLLAAMSEAISSVEVNITSANVRTLSDNRALNRFAVMVRSAEDFKRVINSLDKVRGVVKVREVRQRQ